MHVLLNLQRAGRFSQQLIYGGTVGQLKTNSQKCFNTVLNPLENDHANKTAPEDFNAAKLRQTLGLSDQSVCNPAGDLGLFWIWLEGTHLTHGRRPCLHR